MADKPTVLAANHLLTVLENTYRIEELNSEERVKPLNMAILRRISKAMQKEVAYLESHGWDCSGSVYYAKGGR